MSLSTPSAPRPSHHRREWLVVSASLMALSFAATWWHWTWHLDQAVYDTAQSTWQREAAPDILIVAIDDASVQAVGRWPWRRAVHAQALKLIGAAGPKAILLDLLLSEPDADPEQDAVLAKAMQEAGKVVLPVSHVLDGLGQGHELRPIGAYLSVAKLAHADAALDMDGAVRQAYLWAGSQAHRYPHPALAMLEVAGEWPAGLPSQPPLIPDAATAQWQRQAPEAIAYLGPPGRVAHVSYAALLRGEVPADTFKGRHVLIGVTAHGLGETFQTPVSPMGQGMSGVEVIAQTLDALRQGARIRTLPAAANAGVAALLALALLWSFRRATPRQALLNSLGLAFGAVLASWALMAGGWWWPPFGLVLGALLSYPVWSWRRLEATARQLEAELHAMAAEPATPGLPGTVPGIAPKPVADFMQQRTDALSQAGAQLRHARQLLAHTLSALPDAVFVVDAAHLITQVNQQACAMTGFGQPAALLGQRLGDVLAPLSPSDAPTWDMLLDKVRHSRLPQTTSASHPRGKQYLVAMVATDEARQGQDGAGGGQGGGAIVCATDVTALQEAELQRTELLGFIAHDIRSPQASLISLVDLHRIGGSMPQEETLQHVEAMARHTLELCEELLQVMRAETRAIAPEQGDLIKLASDCLSEMQLQARAKDIGLHGNWREGSQHAAVFDDYLVHRALTNLLSNAVKFSPKGGQVSVEVTRDATHHVIAVRDQGPGIPDSELGRLFKRYERVEQGRPSKLAAGIGLGLVFIDTVARRHGGLVKVINKPGEGACFELWLPIDLGVR